MDNTIIYKEINKYAVRSPELRMGLFLQFLRSVGGLGGFVLRFEYCAALLMSGFVFAFWS